MRILYHVVSCRDRKKKKFVQVDSDQKNKRVKTESGAWISASYKTNMYPFAER